MSLEPTGAIEYHHMLRTNLQAEFGGLASVYVYVYNAAREQNT